jgi:hypothetical protein
MRQRQLKKAQQIKFTEPFYLPYFIGIKFKKKLQNIFLLHSHRLGQVARLIHIRAFNNCYVVT